MPKLAAAIFALLLLVGALVGCAMAPAAPTATPTLAPPTATATPAPELAWQIDRVLRSTGIPARSKFLTAEPDRVFLIIHATVRNISLKPQPLYESRTQVRVPKSGSSDWTIVAVDGAATSAASDAFELKGLNAGYLGVAVPTIEPTKSERFAVVYSIPAEVTTLQFAPQGMPPLDLTQLWSAAEAYQPSTPTPTPTVTPTQTSTPVPPTATPTLTGTPSPLLKVVQVVDGDTFRVDLGGGKRETIRIIGIDAPQLVDPSTAVQCFSGEAAARARALLDGKRVRLLIDKTQVDRDKDDRLLRYVEREDGLDVGLELLKGGFAKEYSYYVSYQRKDQYVTVEADARTASAGLWSPVTCNGDTKQAATPTPKPTATPTRTPTKTPTITPTVVPKPGVTGTPKP